MSGDCDMCGSYDHVETSCPTTRLNAEGGCQRCGLLGCEWANGEGTQHRVIVKLIPVTAEMLDTEWRDAIKQAVAEGGTLREVGEAAGVSHTAVKFIVYGRPEK